MKVYIGPYINRWTTSDIEHRYLRWRFKDDYWNIKDEQLTKFDRWFINRFLDGFWQNVLNYTINLYLDRKQRKIKIEIDRWDTWGMDHTLSLIALPMLKQLQATKHGSPFIDDEDVPENLRSTAEPVDEENDSEHKDSVNVHAKWTWVMDEMIHAHEQVVDDENDYLRDEAENERIQNGLALFGKYYQGLWD